MQILLYLLYNYFIYGCIYITFETFFNAFAELKNQKNLKLMGYSSIWMFPTGGLIGASLSALLLIFPNFLTSLIFLPAFLLASGIIITSIEFFLGLLFNKVLKWYIWDYSNERFNVLGVIQLYRSIGWCFLGIPIFFISSLIKYYVIT